ncbi:universal stress protein [Zobellella iuensis]|uniref:Universal stress protein n=1 Tax=Zobellella iuensis TaxID=2803811 RepID=A0ABS1QMH6_9GAMM|nr:universal stress protein [Zobellella iuensis]MBL1376069.1 universal stress protein [Zobellella iuensis]
MFRHCVAGIDFSAGWDRVQARLRHMMALFGIRELTLVYADEPHRRAHKDTTGRTNRQLHLEQVAADLGRELGIAVHGHFVSGFAVPSILDTAKKKEADLIVVANRSHSRSREFFMGNVALNLARMSKLPLLIVPSDLGTVEDDAPLLLATDNSPASARARTCFAELLGADRKGLVMVVSNPDHQVAFEEVQAGEAVIASNANLDTRTVVGDPVEEICEAANDVKTPLIVLGKRGTNPIAELPLGSTAEGICRHATNPVLLVPS